MQFSAFSTLYPQIYILNKTRRAKSYILNRYINTEFVGEILPQNYFTGNKAIPNYFFDQSYVQPESARVYLWNFRPLIFSSFY